MARFPTRAHFSLDVLHARAENKRIIRRLVMLFLATGVATLLCGLAIYLLQRHADDSAINLARGRGRSMAPSVPSSVTADQAGFVTRGTHSG